MRLALLLIASTTIASSACRQARDFLPRTHTESTSPDGKYTAWVRQEINIDPPDDHLFLKGPDGRTHRLMDLAPDADWCRSMTWTADSGRVAFLVTDNRLTIFDVTSREHVVEVPLVKIDGYPGSEEVQKLAFSPDGASVTFDRADRRSHSVIAHETLVLPTARLRLRPTWRDTGQAAGITWAKLVAPDGREVRVKVQPDAEGLATLPAFHPGPLKFVELRNYKGKAWQLLRNVTVRNTPLRVEFDRP